MTLTKGDCEEIYKIFYQWSVGFAQLRPLAETEGSVKVYGDDLI